MVKNLTDGTTYTFQLRGVNRIGDGTPSAEARATSFTLAPLKPTGLKAVAGDRQVTLSWNDPNDASIMMWQYQQKKDNGNYGNWIDISGSDATTTRYVVGNLTYASYTFKVRAVNTGCNGTESDEVTATPLLSAPAAPTGLRVVESDKRVTLFWNNSNDASIRLWEYRSRKKSEASFGGWIRFSLNAATTRYAVTGLDNGIPYVFQLRARNDVGPGLEAEVQGWPVRIGAAPLDLTAKIGNGRVTLSWTDPGDANHPLESTVEGKLD